MLLLAATPAAGAAAPPERSGDPALTSVDRPPERILTAARSVPRVARVLERRPGVRTEAFRRDGTRWQVAFFDRDEEVAQVHLDRRGRVTEAWTGTQVAWPMARGYPGAFGRSATWLPVWLAGLVLFLAPFARPPWRMLHLDLVVLCSLSVSVALFSAGHVEASVPLAYPPLLYLLARLLHLARTRRPPAALKLVAPGLLGLGIVFLVGFRVAMQTFDANVVDVGYAGVIGADRLAHLRDLYGSFPADNPHGDTYGPLLYLAYVPFELVQPWSGTWDDLPAAHAAATAFDLACAAGLFLAGGRGTRGRLLAYLWLACPFTLMIANSGANDALAGAAVLGAVAWRSGALAAAAGMVKLAPLVLLPLLVRTRRSAVAAAAVLLASLALVLLADGGLADFWSRAIRFQSDRATPFSVWGLYDLGTLRTVAVAAVAVLALLAARQQPADRFALAAALLLALQLTAGHWFYLYLGWLLPVALVALLAPYAIGRSTGSIDSARPDSDDQRTSTPMSQGSTSVVS